MFAKWGLCIPLLRAAARLDVFDVTYEHSNERLGILDLEAGAYPRKGALVRLASYLMWMFRHAWWGITRGGARLPDDSRAFFASSKNEYDSLSPIAERLERAHFIGQFGRGRGKLNLATAYLVGLLFLPLVLARWYRSTGYQRKSFRYILDQYLLGYGVYCVARWWMRATRPQLLVVSNHLAAANRALLMAARAEKVPTLYFLHATISDIYPALDTDYSLLEGMDTLLKYDALGNSASRVFLVGMAKHDRYRDAINSRTRVASIGLCINGLDPTERVEQLCRCLSGSFPALRVILRPHPADRRAKHWMQIAQQFSFGYSDWQQENAFDFLAKVDANVAGDSGIHLEAALSNVVPLYYAFDGKAHDMYSFRRNGLVDFAADVPGFENWLCGLTSQAKFDTRQRARRYCATVGTPWDWRSAELSLAVVEQIASGANPVTPQWRRVAGVALEAYEPALNDSHSHTNTEDSTR
jgi:hypothetical protein